MSVGSSMSDAWHNHPYIIMGVGGAIVLYFLWPSSSAPSSSSGSSDYANQLAAETALSQSQLAEQAQSVQGQQQATAAEDAAAFAAVGQSNEAIAASNAASIIAENQTSQAGIAAEGANALAQTQSKSNDFAAMIAGLTAFGNQTTAQDVSSSQTGLDAYLAGLGTTFSNTGGGDLNVETGAAPSYSFYTSQGNSTGNAFGGGFFGGLMNTFSQWGNQGTTPNPLATDLGTDVKSASAPFAASQDILNSLWTSVVKQNADIQAAPVVSLPTIQFAPPTLAGAIQPIPAVSPVP